MYKFDINLEEKLFKYLWIFYWALLAAFIVLAFFVYSSFLAFVAALSCFSRAMIKAKRQHKELVNNPDSQPYLSLNEKDFYYTKGPNKYNVLIPYSDILSIKFQKLFGLNKVSFGLEGNRGLVLWKIKESEHLINALQKHNKAIKYVR